MSLFSAVLPPLSLAKMSSVLPRFPLLSSASTIRPTAASRCITQAASVAQATSPSMPDGEQSAKIFLRLLDRQMYGRKGNVKQERSRTARL